MKLMGFNHEKRLFLKTGWEPYIATFCLIDIFYGSLQNYYEVEHVFILR